MMQVAFRANPLRSIATTRASLLKAWMLGALAAAMLAGCQADDELNRPMGTGPKHMRQVSSETRSEMAKLNMSSTSPVLMRIFKEESAFEVWKQDRSGRYVLLKSYEICKWSGGLGPKIKEGDRQAPEGYYTITPALMNPNSSYYLAFNTGYPNSYDRSYGRTGANLMVHGACSSRGCYAMSDAQIQEIYALARDSFRGGQTGFQLAAYPFRMTPENMGKHYDDPNMPFWRMLKEGYDHFELTRQEPKVDVCGRKYVFNVKAEGPMNPTAACPAMTQPEQLRIAAAKKAADDEAKTVVFAAAFAKERKQAEEKATLLAAKEEERKQREEEQQIALAERRIAFAEREAMIAERAQQLASLFGISGGAKVAAETQQQVAVATAQMVVTPAAYSNEGVPLPRRDPRAGTGVATNEDSSLPALAIAPQEQPPAGVGSMVSRLFTFGDDTVPQAPAAATLPAAPAEPEATASTAAQTSAGPVVSVAGAEPACDPTVAGIESGCPQPIAPVQVAPAPPTDKSIMDRIGSWF